MAENLETLLVTDRFRVVRKTEVARDGKSHSREYIEHPGAVTILPIHSDGRVLMIRNRRPAVGATLVELVAGTLDPGEAPETTARRELKEETGYQADHFKQLCEFHTSPGILSERMFLFLATGLTPGEAEPEPTETIEPFLVAWEEALAMIDRGEIHDGKTLVGLLLYERMRQRGEK